MNHNVYKWGNYGWGVCYKIIWAGSEKNEFLCWRSIKKIKNFGLVLNILALLLKEGTNNLWYSLRMKWKWSLWQLKLYPMGQDTSWYIFIKCSMVQLNCNNIAW